MCSAELQRAVPCTAPVQGLGQQAAPGSASQLPVPPWEYNDTAPDSAHSSACICGPAALFPPHGSSSGTLTLQALHACIAMCMCAAVPVLRMLDAYNTQYNNIAWHGTLHKLYLDYTFIFVCQCIQHMLGHDLTLKPCCVWFNCDQCQAIESVGAAARRIANLSTASLLGRDHSE